MLTINLSTLSIKVLKQLRRHINREIKRRRQEMVADLKLGDKVIHRYRPRYGIGIVTGLSKTGQMVAVEWPKVNDSCYCYPESLSRVDEEW